MAGEVEQTIHQMNRAFEAAVARKDLEALTRDYYAQYAQLLATGAPIATGGEEIRRVLQGLLDMGAETVMLETVKVESSGELAYEVGRYTLRFAGGMADQGKYMVVFRRQEGGWRAVADAFNSNVAPP